MSERTATTLAPATAAEESTEERTAPGDGMDVDSAGGQQPQDGSVDQPPDPRDHPQFGAEKTKRAKRTIIETRGPDTQLHTKLPLDEVDIGTVGAQREETSKDNPGSGVRKELDLIELPMHSDNVLKVYSALRAVGKELNIPDEQWQETVTDPVRARDTPKSWKLANPKKPKGTKPKGTLKIDTAREVVIFAPQCVVNSTVAVEQQLQVSWDADQPGPVPQSVDREVPEEVPSAARVFTFGHLTVDEEAGTGPWVRAIFRCGTQMPCIELTVEVGIPPDQPRKARVFIFGTNLTRAEGVLPIEMHTGKTPEIEKYAYDHMASPKVQREQPQLCRPELYEEIRAKKVTCIDVKLLGGPNDTNDIEGRPAKLKFAGQMSMREYQRWAKDAVTASDHMTDAERFLGLLYAGSLRHFKLYYTYRNNIAAAEYPEHEYFCKYFQSVMLFANRLGHFWFFRQQTPEASWQSPNFPFGVMEPPRWTVTSREHRKKIDWADQIEDKEEEEIPLPEPAEWASLNLPPIWAGREEPKFLYSLGLSQERQVSHDYLQKLMAALAEDIDVILHKNPYNEKAYRVELFCDIDSAKLGSVIPLPDTSLTITLRNKVKLSGKIVTSGGQRFEQQLKGFGKGKRLEKHNRGPDFVASVIAPTRSNMQVDGSKMKATVVFMDDNTAFQRQFSAMMGSCKYPIDANGDADLGFCDDGSKVVGEGIYVPQLLFNADLPGNWDANTRRKLLSDKTMEVFHKELKRFRLLSEEQRNFSLGCLAPANALAIGNGPPGSSKTTTIAATAQSALKAGFKVLICTQTEGAKKQLTKAWKDASDPAIHQGKWCDWTGARIKSGYQINPEFQALRHRKMAKPKANAPEPVPEPCSKRRKVDKNDKGKTPEQPAPGAAATANADDEEDFPMVDKLGDNTTVPQEAELAELAKEKADTEAARELLNTHMEAYWIDQTMSLSSRTDVHQYDFDYRRAQMATVLAVHPEFGGISKVAEDWKKTLVNNDTDLRDNKQMRKKFMADEVMLNDCLLGQFMKLVFATCNDSGHDILVERFRPDIIIIEECDAALTTEMAIPIVAYQDHAKSVVLIGNHQPRAPIFVSGNRNSAANVMQRTMFERYAKGHRTGAVRPDLQPFVFFFSA